MNSVGAYNQMLEEKVEDLENKIINLEQENFDLRNKLNTEEECCVMLEKKVKKLNNLIKILEEKFFIDIIERENDYKIGFEPKIPIVENIGYDKIGLKTRFAQINNDEAKLLKEFLENDS